MKNQKVIFSLIGGFLWLTFGQFSHAVTFSKTQTLRAGDVVDDMFRFDNQFGGAVGNGPNGTASGSAYAYVRTADGWIEPLKLIPSDGAAQDRFGDTVAISGNTAVIGAPGDGDNGLSSGSVYVFVRTADGWVEQQKLTPVSVEAGDSFGSAISMSNDTVIIGADGQDSGAPDDFPAPCFSIDQ